jgi:hypothetical protein
MKKEQVQLKFPKMGMRENLISLKHSNFQEKMGKKSTDHSYM